jgi:hypothetical protein
MATLKDLLQEPAKRRAIVDDCARLVDEEVSAKGGLSGLAIKGAYAVVKAIKPGMVRDACEHLIDEFVEKLEPYWADHKAKGSGTFVAFLSPKSTEVANALLGVTDRKAARAKNPTIKKAYEKLRPTGVKNVESAVPGVAKIIERHAPA